MRSTKTPFSRHQKSRRSFIKNVVALTALATSAPMLGLSPLNAFSAKKHADEMMHGIKIGAVSFVDEGSTIFRDVPLEELMRFNNHLLNYGNEASLADLPTAGLSPDYVFRETQRALEGVKGKCKILPGIDIGIPTKASSRKGSPEDAYKSTAAAYKANSHGFILSRKYSEMNLADIDAAGRAIREAIKERPNA